MQNRIFILIYIIILITVCKVSAQEKGFIPYKLNKKWIVLNDSCKIISTEKYDTICLMNGGLARVKQNRKWGVLNRECIAVIPIYYDTIGDFDGHEFAIVKRGKKWGYINRRNETIIPIIYDELGKFNSIYNDVQVKKNDSVYYINRKGEWVDITKTRNFGVCGGAKSVSIRFNARIIKNKNGLYGLFSEGRSEGNDTLLPCVYKQINSTYTSNFAILVKEKYSLYNTANEKMVLVDCDSISFYKESEQTYWILYRKKEITGIIHPYGREQIEINYKTIKIITGDFIYITDDKNQAYYINYKGKKYIPKTN